MFQNYNNDGTLKQIAKEKKENNNKTGADPTMNGRVNSNNNDINIDSKSNGDSINKETNQIHSLRKYTLIISMVVLVIVAFVVLCSVAVSVINANKEIMNTNRELVNFLKNKSNTNYEPAIQRQTNTINDTYLLFRALIASLNAPPNNSDATCANQTESIYLSSKATEHLQIHHSSSPGRILPGVQFLAYSFNQLQGSPPTDLILQGNYRQIIEFTYLQGRISSGSDDYLVPDQLDLPSISGVCSTESSTTSVSSSTSTSSMYSESAEATGQKSFSASVSASGWGASVSGSVAMSSSYSNSRSSTSSKKHARSGKTSSSYTYSKALLYSTQLRWSTINSYTDEFIAAISAIENSNNDYDINKNTMLFFGDFGTHVLDLAKMGARCRTVSYFQSSMSSEALSYGSSSANSNSASESYATEVSASYGGFAASASASFSQSASTSYQQSSESSSESSIETEYQSETLDCVGEVDVTTMCGDMLGTKNQPSLVGYRMKKVWDLPVFDEYPLAKKYILKVLKNISDSGAECGINKCGGLGMCGIDQSFWTLLTYKDWTVNSSFQSLWDSTTCFDQYQIGTSILPQGNDVSTQMNQCSNTSVIDWGERYQSSQISFDPFCSDEYGIQIALGLNLVNLSVSFDVQSSLITDQGFSVTYGLLSTGDYDCTSVGGISYALFCENTNVRVSNISVGANYIMVQDAKTWIEAEQYCIDTYGSHLATILTDDAFAELTIYLDTSAQYWIGLNTYLDDITDMWSWAGTTGTDDWINANNWHDGYPTDGIYCGNLNYFENWGFVNDACTQKKMFFCNKNSVLVTAEPILNCKDNVYIQSIAAINGYNYKQTSIDGFYTNFEYYVGMGITGLTPTNLSSVEVEYDTFGGSLTFDISIIHFCYEHSFIRFGVEEFLIDKDVTLNTSYIKRKWIKFDPLLQCTAVNIWVGFSYFDGHNICSNAVWTENNKGGNGFTLVVAAWETRDGGYACARGVDTTDVAQCGTYRIVRRWSQNLLDHMLCNEGSSLQLYSACATFPSLDKYPIVKYPHFYTYQHKGTCVSNVGSGVTIDTTIYVFINDMTGDNYLTTSLSFTPKEWRILGFCSKNNPNDGNHAPLYELYHQGRSDHFYVISLDEMNTAINIHGYQQTSNGILCYVRKDDVQKSAITTNVHVSWLATCQKF
eukprot:277246_1